MAPSGVGCWPIRRLVPTDQREHLHLPPGRAPGQELHRRGQPLLRPTARASRAALRPQSDARRTGTRATPRQRADRRRPVRRRPRPHRLRLAGALPRRTRAAMSATLNRDLLTDLRFEHRDDAEGRRWSWGQSPRSGRAHAAGESSAMWPAPTRGLPQSRRSPPARCR
jgi:hypothetical protein